MTGRERKAADPDRMSFLEHLDELRRRLLYTIIVLVLATCVCFALAPTFFELVRAPVEELTGQHMQVTAPMEMFVTYIKLAVLLGIFLSAPWTLLQLWIFVAPGLYASEKRWVVPFLFFGTLFFVAGGFFAYKIVLPIGFKYLIQMVPDYVTVALKVSEYYSFVVAMVLAFGVVFELPLVMWLLGAAGIVKPASMARVRKYWIVVAFVIGGVITPGPDPFSQLLMAVPLLVFFEIGILGARILSRRRAQDPQVSSSST